MIWETALFSGKILSPALLAYMTHRELGHYGTGKFYDTRHGEALISHSVAMERIATASHYLPDRSISVIVLSNIQPSTEWAISDQLMDVMLG